MIGAIIFCIDDIVSARFSLGGLLCSGETGPAGMMMMRVSLSPLSQYLV